MDYVQVITWAHYFSRDAMLKMTKIKLELIPDPDMYVFFEKGTKPGICYISNRYNKANSKYLKSYDPKSWIKAYYILRPNNLSVYAMTKFL